MTIATAYTVYLYSPPNARLDHSIWSQRQMLHLEYMICGCRIIKLYWVPLLNIFSALICSEQRMLSLEYNIKIYSLWIIKMYWVLVLNICSAFNMDIHNIYPSLTTKYVQEFVILWACWKHAWIYDLVIQSMVGNGA